MYHNLIRSTLLRCNPVVRIAVNESAFSLRRIQPARTFSTSADGEAITTNDDNGDNLIVLYERGPDRNRLPRSGLAVSTFHTMYWIWYGIDFVPTINASDLDLIKIDPMIPVVGTLLGAVIQTVFYVYPYRLVHRLSWNPSTNELYLWNYRVPFVTPNPKPRKFDMGTLTMDAASPDTERVLNEGGLHRYTGHLAVSLPNSWPPFLLDIREPSDVPEPAILLEALLQPELMTKDQQQPKKKEPKAHRKPRRRRR